MKTKKHLKNHIAKNDRTRHSRVLAGFAGATLSLLAAQHASAADRTWTGGGTPGNNWGSSGNWSAAVIPGASDRAFFTGAGAYSIVLGGSNRAANNINFNSATPYTINLYSDSSQSTVRTLTLGTGGATVVLGDHTIKGRDGVSGTDGDLILNSGAAFSIAEGSSLTLEARLRHNVISATYSKTGAGTLVINANNGGSKAWQFSSGLFTVSEGTVEFAAAGATGNSNNKFKVESGATIEISAESGYTAGNGTLQLSGTGVGGVGALYASTTTTFSSGGGSLTLNANSRIGVAAGQTFTVDQNITGDFDLEKSGSGTLLLDSITNDYTGATFVSAGTLLVNGSLASDSNVTVASNAAIGGLGAIGGSLNFESGAILDLTTATIGLSSTNILTVGGSASITFNNFQFADIIGWDWQDAEAGTYTLINGASDVFLLGGTPTIGSPADLGNGKFGYFQEGSFQAVIIPEPSTALLGGLGVLVLLRRRRA